MGIACGIIISRALSGRVPGEEAAVGNASRGCGG